MLANLRAIAEFRAKPKPETRKLVDILVRLMLIHLPPGFEPAAHARHILEAVFNEVSSGAETAVTVVAINDHRCLFVDVLNEFLNVTVMKVPRAGYMGRAIGTRIANIDEDTLFLVEFFLGLVYLYLWYVVHYLAPCLCSIHHRLILQATVVRPATVPFTARSISRFTHLA